MPSSGARRRRKELTPIPSSVADNYWYRTPSRLGSSLAFLASAVVAVSLASEDYLHVNRLVLGAVVTRRNRKATRQGEELVIER